MLGIFGCKQGGLRISPHDFSGTSDSRVTKCFEQKLISFQWAINCNIKSFKQNFTPMKVQGLS